MEGTPATGPISDDAQKNGLALKFRNYQPTNAHLQHEKVGIAHPAEFQEKEAEVKPDKLASVDAVIATAPKKPNWDLKRDIEKKMEKLERRTQRALFELAQEEEKRRMEEAGGIADA